MEIDALFDSLLAIGRFSRFSGASELPGAGDHREVLRIADTHRKALLTYFDKLVNSDRIGFIKAIAVYEDTVGGLGSVTVIDDLLPRLTDPNRETLDWILKNTCSYWYYSHDARSVAELDTWEQWNSARRAKSLEREREREAMAKAKKAERATGNLTNAIRRGDITAVKALLNIGADPTIKTNDGTQLYDYAESIGHIDIANLLKSIADPDLSVAPTRTTAFRDDA